MFGKKNKTDEEILEEAKGLIAAEIGADPSEFKDMGQDVIKNGRKVHIPFWEWHAKEEDDND